jgi:ferric-dicitrate binding protein FerR (iron transport regulator)
MKTTERKSLAFFAALAALTLVPVLAAAQSAAAIVECEGKVEVRPEGEPAWQAAAPGMNIALNTAISTGVKSSAVVQIGSSRVLVRPLTRLTLEEIAAAAGQEEVSLYLRAGRIRAEVEPPRGGQTNFTVRSPVSTVAVRGTSFEFDTINLVVDEGRIRYSYRNGLAVYVAEKEYSFAEERLRRVTPPQEIFAVSRVPRLPEYAGVDEGAVIPRFPFAAPDEPPPSSGITLNPSWIP